MKSESPNLEFDLSRGVATTTPAAVSRQSSNQLIGQLAVGSSNQADMELESEGVLAGAMQALELDSKVRAEANLGFEQIRSIEQQLRTAPQGFLGRADLSDARDLRTTIFSSSVTIVGSFTKIIGLLSAPNTASVRNDGFSTTNRVGSPFTSLTYESTPPHSPLPHGIAPAGTSKEPTTTNVASPPHSGSGMSDDSPNPSSPPPMLLESDGDAVAAAAAVTNVAGGSGGRARRSPNEASTSTADAETKQRSLSVKRKFMPRYTVKQPASGTDPGNDGPPDDGHTWRKYGQKDILGSRNPRSYYRCTHKIELGCPAIKYTQRCDEDPSMFDVTYRGTHTCQSIQQQYSAWPFSCTPEQLLVMTRAHHSGHQLSPPDSAIGHYPAGLGGSHLPPSLPPPSSATQASHEILLSGSSIRHNFSELAGGLSIGGVGSSASAGSIPSASTPRFGTNPNLSIELGAHHPQDFPTKRDDGSSSQQAGVFDVSKLQRDSLFESSTLYQMIMASSRTPDQNDLSSTLMDEGPPSHVGDVKRTRLQPGPIMEQARSILSEANSRQLDKSTPLQYEQRWPGAELGAELDLFHLQLDEQVPVSHRYNSSSSIMSDNSRELLRKPTTSTEGGRIASIKESATPEHTPVLHSMAFDLDDMETFDGQSFHGSSSGFYC